MNVSRRNLWLGIGLVALVQAGALAWMIWERASLLAHGREIVLDVVPVDPRSLFRGDYVILGYDISRFDNAPGVASPPRGATVYVTIAKDAAGKWRVAGASAEHPGSVAPGQVVLKGRVDYAGVSGDGKPAPTGVDYGIESFFVPEGAGRELEKLVRERKLSAVIAVDEAGNAGIKGLMADGERVYEEPLL
jgi:uncharacterized membrane-anchored protein